MPDGLESLPQDSLDMAVQLQSMLSHLKERVDVLRATARQGVDVEILARLYVIHREARCGRLSKKLEGRTNEISLGHHCTV